MGKYYSFPLNIWFKYIENNYKVQILKLKFGYDHQNDASI